MDIREGPNVHRSFDGISLRLKRDKWDVTALATKLARNRTGVFDSFTDPGTTFWGIYAVRQLSKTKDAKGSKSAEGKNIDLYYLGVARNRLVFDIGVGDDLRHLSLELERRSLSRAEMTAIRGRALELSARCSRPANTMARA